MKKILFLLLFPCFVVAQYPGNANQKITLGEQTTADGLVYRGVAADTTRKPSVDTMAYILLDTNTNIIWQYKKATSNAWTRVGGSISSGLNGVLPVANGGTGATSLSGAGIVTGTGTTNYIPKFTSSSAIGNSLMEEVASGISFGGPIYAQDGTSTSAIIRFYNSNSGLYHTGSDGLGFITDGSERMRITSGGEVWIGYTADNGAYLLQVNGQIFATNATIATSDEKFKENITPLNKGLEIVNKLKPVTFNFISDTKNNFSEYEEVGFIAQDVDRALSTETFSKSIVKSADDSEPTSTMGLATQNLIPILVKAIQEQQALIKALEQRIINLENK